MWRRSTLAYASWCCTRMKNGRWRWPPPGCWARVSACIRDERCVAAYAPARIRWPGAMRDDRHTRQTEESTMSSPYFHAMVWIDHREAKVFHFDAEHADTVVVHNSHAHQNLHHKANSIDSGHVPVDKE